MSKQCNGVTLKGTKCTIKTKSDFCRFHKSQDKSVSMSRIFTVVHEDGWHSGPHLEMYEKGMEGYFSDSEDLPMNAITNVEFDLINTEYHVFHLIMYLEGCKIKFLKSFDNYEKADDYSKQQYFLVTGDYPFIHNGDDNGERKEIPIIYTKDITLIDDDTHEYLIIINNDIVEAHSLNCFAEW